MADLKLSAQAGVRKYNQMSVYNYNIKFIITYFIAMNNNL